MNQSQLNEELYEQCSKGNLELVKFLVKQGANIEAKTITNLTPLLIASDRGHLEVVKYLKEQLQKVKEKKEREFVKVKEVDLLLPFVKDWAQRGNHDIVLEYLKNNC